MPLSPRQGKLIVPGEAPLSSLQAVPQTPTGIQKGSTVIPKSKLSQNSLVKATSSTTKDTNNLLQEPQIITAK